MIESTINKPKNDTTPRDYPYLGLYECSNGDKQVVLFTGPKTGVIVYSYGMAPVGSYVYVETWDESRFQLYDGEIILKNKG